jgi:hypothetical protein
MDKVYSAEEIVKNYGHLIEEVVRERTSTISNRCIEDIDTICESIGIEYDWKNSSEGFENWLPRMVQEGKMPDKTFTYILNIWNRYKETDEEWKAVYYGIKQYKR